MDKNSKPKQSRTALPEKHPSLETINKPAEPLTKEYIEVIEDDEAEEKDQPLEPPPAPAEGP